jgi:hypothetical protein
VSSDGGGFFLLQETSKGKIKAAMLSPGIKNLKFIIHQI